MSSQQDENEKILHSQREQLELMSNKLIYNLQMMIDEQTKRSAEFAERKESVSTLSFSAQLPPISAAPLAHEMPLSAATTSEQAQPLPPLPAAHQKAHTRTETPASTIPRTPTRSKQEWPWQTRDKKEEQEGLGMSAIIVFVIIGFLVTVCSG